MTRFVGVLVIELFAAVGLAGVPVPVLTAFSEAAAPEAMSWSVDGDAREALLYPPARGTHGKPALVLAFHGYGDDMHNFQHVELHLAMPDAVVVYPRALPSPNGLRRWQVERGQTGDRDLKFVDAMLTGLTRRFSVDDRRMYATGYSNGGGLTYLLWAERPSRFAAFAPVAGRLHPTVQPRERRPLLHVAGSRDTTVAFADQEASFRAAIAVNGGGGASEPCGDGCTRYGGSSVAPVMVWIHPGSHTYPDGTSDRIARFFREFPRR